MRQSGFFLKKNPPRRHFSKARLLWFRSRDMTLAKSEFHFSDGKSRKVADNRCMSYEQPTPEELVRESLLRLMEDQSEDCWCASWLRDLEFSLWNTITTGKTDWGFGMRDCDLARLKHLHEMAGGWWIWADDEVGRRFVTTEEWLAILARNPDKGRRRSDRESS
jgi:hypothetical protein